jgi:peptidoglycan/LPS O-acetylase OafA/YrhL
MSALTPALKPFNFMRAFFSTGVILFHCLMWGNGGVVRRTSPDWTRFVRTPALFPRVAIGMHAVPVFFVMSAFFITLPILRRLEAGEPLPSLPAALLSRYLRLAFLLAAVVVIVCLPLCVLCAEAVEAPLDRLRHSLTRTPARDSKAH